MTIVITPSLLMGEDEPTTLPHVRCETPDAALAAINAGDTAWIPQDDDEAARWVLHSLGLTDEEVEDRLLYARTGSAGADDPERILPRA